MSVRPQDGQWVARVKPGGRTGRLQQRTFPLKREAEAWERKILAEYDRGAYVDPKDSRTPLGELAEEWRTSRLHRAGTAKSVDGALRNHILPTFGDRPIGQIRKSHIETWVKDRSEVLKPRTVKTVFGILATIMGSALTDRLITWDPTLGVALPQPPDEDMVILTVDQVRALEAAMPAHYRVAILIAAGTGLRVSEVLGLTLNESIPFPHRELHVIQQLVYTPITGRHAKDLDRRTPGEALHLGPPKTKTSRRTVPVPDLVVDALAAHLARYPTHPQEIDVFDGQDWTRETRSLVVTNTKGTPVGYTFFSNRTFNPASIAAGLPRGTTFHSLRDHYASLLIHDGCSVKEVQMRLGHSSPQTTLNTYVGLWPNSEDRTRNAVDRAWRQSPGMTSRSL